MAKAKKPTKKSTNRTLVTFLLDRSGSMSAVQGSTIEAFNSYLEGLKKSDAEIEFTLLTFDSSPTCQIDKVCLRAPVNKVAPLSTQSYQPRGSTPLIESAFKTIKAVEESLKGKGTKVVICIQTDGEENSSDKEFTWEGLNTLIAEKQKAGWEFNFMGAGIDAYKQGSRMGIATSHTVSYNHLDREATRNTFSARGLAHSSYAAGMASNTAFTAKEKLDAGDKFDPQKASFMNIGGTSTPTKGLDLDKETKLKL